MWRARVEATPVVNRSCFGWQCLCGPKPDPAGAKWRFGWKFVFPLVFSRPV